MLEKKCRDWNYPPRDCILKGGRGQSGKPSVDCFSERLESVSSFSLTISEAKPLIPAWWIAITKGLRTAVFSS
jgi:hypothetical protein